MFTQPDEILPPPSPEAVQSICEIINLLKGGNRKEAGRLLGNYYRIVSPKMMAADKLRFLNDAIASGKTEITYRQSRMEFDWVYYADAALRLNLVDVIDNKEMLEAINVVKTSNPPMQTSPELTECYNQFQNSGRKQPSAVHRSPILELIARLFKRS